MDNGLIVPYLHVEVHEPLVKLEPLSGLRWQIGDTYDAGRKPEVWGTPRQEKLRCC